MVFDIDSYQPILDAIQGFIHVNNDFRWVQEAKICCLHLKALYLLVADKLHLLVKMVVRGL